MSYQDAGFSTMYDRQDDYDLDEDNEEYLEEDRDAEEQDESDEGDDWKKLHTSVRGAFFPHVFHACNFWNYNFPLY